MPTVQRRPDDCRFNRENILPAIKPGNPDDIQLIPKGTVVSYKGLSNFTLTEDVRATGSSSIAQSDAAQAAIDSIHAEGRRYRAANNARLGRSDDIGEILGATELHHPQVCPAKEPVDSLCVCGVSERNQDRLDRVGSRKTRQYETRCTAEECFGSDSEHVDECYHPAPTELNGGIR